MQNVDLIVQMLEDAGIQWVFGVPSGPVLPLIEALRSSRVEYVLTASETSAGFMAQVVGALTGVPGVCVSTLGPGATNLATGVGAAWLDRSPLIAITCNVDTPWLERRIQMRIDHEALFRPLTKGSFALRRDSVAAPLAEAFRLACAEPPGPVHLDLPEDVGLAPATEPAVLLSAGRLQGTRAHEGQIVPSARNDSPEQGAARPLPPQPEASIDRVGRALAASRRPLVVAGLGLTRLERPGRLLELVERQNIPFILTLHAKGYLPESHPNYAGVIGRARRSDVQAFIRTADLIIGVGFDPVEINYEEWAADRPIVHVSSELAEESEGLRFVVNAAGDLDNTVESLARLDPHPNDWTASEIAAHRTRLERNLRPPGPGFSAHHVLDVLRPRLSADAILAYDVGAHTHQIATQWRTDLQGTCLCTNGWSSMGYGIPAAYAAKLVHPERTVVGIVGDGCFQMTAGELTVGRRLGLAVPIVVLNDGWLSLLRLKQEHRDFVPYGVYLGEPLPSPPHYFGVPCRGVRSEGELREALDWALRLDGPSVIEAFIDPSSYALTVYD